MERPKATFVVTVLFLVVLATVPAVAGFIKRDGMGFVDSATSQPFRFGGTNNYYLHYKVTPKRPPSLSSSIITNFLFIGQTINKYCIFLNHAPMAAHHSQSRW
jgi:hypothetical protein